ncbi:unnamed protein product [Gongylonema pulchrum]|uniref:Transposase n=1 Tax=Gongylonema pulchrum TaxID=637853 RepID=A0A183DYT0_9BILA|nr:unnamed protein product [Gongylonema pulchrum]
MSGYSGDANVKAVQVVPMSRLPAWFQFRGCPRGANVEVAAVVLISSLSGFREVGAVLEIMRAIGSPGRN